MTRTRTLLRVVAGGDARRRADSRRRAAGHQVPVRRGSRSARPPEARPVAGPEARPAHALGHVLAVGHRRVVVALLGRRVVVPPLDGRLRRRTRQRTRRCRRRSIRCGSIRSAGRRPRRTPGMRYVVFTTKHHDGFSMFDTQRDGLPHHVAEDAVLVQPARRRHAGDLRRVSRAGLHGRRVLLEARLAQSRLLVAVLRDARSQSELRHQEVSRAVGALRRVHARADRRADVALRAQSTSSGSTAAGCARGRDAEIRDEINQPDYKFVHYPEPGHRHAAARRRGAREAAGPHRRRPRRAGAVSELPHARGARAADKALPYPWEVPMPMARSWSYVPNDVYKSPRVLIQMLVDVVAKGGNLLLNIGPGPDGAWHDAAYDRLAALGAWMKVNSEAIYATRPIAPYADGKVRFTRAKNGTVYAIYLPRADGDDDAPARSGDGDARAGGGRDDHAARHRAHDSVGAIDCRLRRPHSRGSRAAERGRVGVPSLNGEVTDVEIAHDCVDRRDRRHAQHAGRSSRTPRGARVVPRREASGCSSTGACTASSARASG